MIEDSNGAVNTFWHSSLQWSTVLCALQNGTRCVVFVILSQIY